MTEVRCARCGQTRPGLPAAPLPGKTGEAVLAGTCAACWSEWLGTQVKIINEYRLSPSDPGQFDFLLAQLRAFLNLNE
jgi:Fe-S cluster biosynthesis and repair protein YggX